MKTVEEIALFIEGSQKKRVLKSGQRITGLLFDNGYGIDPSEDEDVYFGQEGEEGFLVNVIQLRTLSPWFNEVCECPECYDKRWYSVDFGPETKHYECECENLPLNIGIQAKTLN